MMEKLKLLLHCCCAPCSTSVVERLLAENKYEITLYYYNPNILPKEEYEKRLAELIRLNKEVYPEIKLVVAEYEPKEFFTAILGKENLGEGSERCTSCIGLRLRKTAEYAKNNGYDIFATTLSVSPHKNATIINELGERYGNEFSVSYLVSDFKKKDGFKRSIELCKKYNIYRQNYCGCNLK